MTEKKKLIPAAGGIALAIFTFICCGILLPLGLIGAAAFFHQYRILLLTLGISLVAVSIFFVLRGKTCICKALCKNKKLTFTLASLIFIGLLILFLYSSSPSLTSKTEAEWGNKKIEPFLVQIVNFLQSNKGKEIELKGERLVITAEEELDVIVVMLECCTKKEFNDILVSFSRAGRVKSSNFSKKEIHAKLPANKIPEIANIWNLERIDFEPESKALWSQALS